MNAEELAALIEAQLKDGRNASAASVVHAGKLAKAAEVEEYWKSIAPHWGDRPTRGATTPTEDGAGKVVDLYPGVYEAGIHVEARGDRVRVGSGDKVAVFLEYGTEHNPEYACAARTVAHFEGEVTERTVNKRGQVSRPNPVGAVEA